MKIGLYLCSCGSLITAGISPENIHKAIHSFPDEPYLEQHEFICSTEGVEGFVAALKKERPDRVIVAACSPRDHEATFRRCMVEAGLNPYLLQVVNVREQISWVTPDPVQATAKVLHALRGALWRVRQQSPLQAIEIEASSDILVVGGGPAGLSATRALAGAGRNVMLVERTASLGGWPIHQEQLFPTMECASCLLDPAIEETLHGEFSAAITLLTLTELIEIKGYFGNFTVTFRQRPRHVDETACISCGACAAVCPAARSEHRKAIDFDGEGSLPHIPWLDESACIRWQGGECSACAAACPVSPDVISFAESSKLYERSVGAVIIAIGRQPEPVPTSQIPEEGAPFFPWLEQILRASSPAVGADSLAALTGLAVDERGFFLPQHPVVQPCSTMTRGVFLAGTCRQPMPLPQAINEGLAAAALVQSELQPGRMIHIEPVFAEIETDRCSGCHLCISLCPYRAIVFDDATGRAAITTLLCRGCGICVSACPSAAITGHQFTDRQIMAEIEGLLS